MKYWVIIALVCLANASDLPQDEEDISSSTLVDELGNRFGSSGIGDSILRALRKISHNGHNKHHFKLSDLIGPKHKGNILDGLKLDVKRGRDPKREQSEILEFLKKIAVFGKNSQGKQGDILKNLLGMNKGNTFQKGQRGDASGINLAKILLKKDSPSLKQNLQTSNLGINIYDVLREIFGGGNSGGIGIGNGSGRSLTKGGGRGLTNGGTRDSSNGGIKSGNTGGGKGLGNSGGRGLGNGGGWGLGNGGGKGIRDGDLFGDGGSGGAKGDGGFGSSKGGDGGTKSVDNIDIKSFNDKEDKFLFLT